MNTQKTPVTEGEEAGLHIECLTCSDNGAVGMIDNSQPCSDCTPSAGVQSAPESLSALDFITLDQLRALRAAGLVVVHSVPSKSMFKAGMSIGKYHYHGAHEYWHRMVAESIRLQNKADKRAMP